MIATHFYEETYLLGNTIESVSSFFPLLKIVEQCWTIDAELLRLHKELEDTALGPVYWPEFSTEPNSADDPELGKVFPVAFHFPSLRTAHTCMLYWTLSIMLWSGLSDLYRVLAAMQPDSNNNGGDDDDDGADSTPLFNISQLPPLEHRVDGRPMVRNICQSLEYCLQDEMRAMGPLTAQFPLQVVIEYLRQSPEHGRELQWAQAAMVKLRKSGCQISRYLDSF